MPRRREVPKREILPDPKFGNVELAKFMNVVMTRGSDMFIPLEERTAIANSSGADLFLSIHANSSRNRTASGIETYFLSLARDRDA